MSRTHPSTLAGRLADADEPAQTPFSDALALVTRAHAGQLRKGTEVPFVTHPVIVAETLAYYYPAEEDLVVAGLLHDVVEDTTTTLDALRVSFGEHVADLVEAVTKPTEDEVTESGRLGAREQFADPHEFRRARWRVQREVMLEHLESGPSVPSAGGDATVRGTRANVLRLKAADALANLRSILRDLRAGVDVWARFKVGRVESLWFYAEIERRVSVGLAGEPLARELQETLKAVASLPDVEATTR